MDRRCLTFEESLELNLRTRKLHDALSRSQAFLAAVATGVRCEKVTLEVTEAVPREVLRRSIAPAELSPSTGWSTPRRVPAGHYEAVLADTGHRPHPSVALLAGRLGPPDLQGYVAQRADMSRFQDGDGEALTWGWTRPGEDLELLYRAARALEGQRVSQVGVARGALTVWQRGALPGGGWITLETLLSSERCAARPDMAFVAEDVDDPGFMRFWDALQGTLGPQNPDIIYNATLKGDGAVRLRTRALFRGTGVDPRPFVAPPDPLAEIIARGRG
jgi:hypothetical protein